MSDDPSSIEAGTPTSPPAKMPVNPIILAVVFFFISLTFRFIDIFILNLDNSMFGILPSKVIPLVILLVYVGVVYRTFSPLGIHSKQFIISVLLGVVVFQVYWVLPILLQFLSEVVLGLAPVISFSNYPVVFTLYWLIFYIVNSFTEEGVFRGLMMRCFMTRTSVLKANFIQSIFFGFWHIVWPIKNFLTGVMDLTTAAWYAVIYVASTICFGFITGYMFQITTSLFGPIVLHTLWNFAIYILFYTNLVPIPPSLYLMILGTAFLTEITGFIFALVITWLIGKRLKAVELSPWDEAL